MATPAARSRAPILRQFRTTGADIAAPTRAARSVRAGTVLRSGIILLVVAGVMAVTAAVGFCPLYALFGFSTCPVKRS